MGSAVDRLLKGQAAPTTTEPKKDSAVSRLLSQREQPTQPNPVRPKRQPIQYKPTNTRVGFTDVVRQVPNAVRQVGAETVNAIARPFQRAGLNIYRTAEGLNTLRRYNGLVDQGKQKEAIALLREFNQRANTGKIASLNPQTGLPKLEETKTITGPVEAAGVGADIGLTVAGSMFTKALGRVNIGRKGFSISKPIVKATVKAAERPEKAIDVLRSVESRMERSSPQGKKVVDLLKESDTRFLPSMGKKATVLADTKIGKLKDPIRITDALEGRIKSKTLSKSERKVFNVINNIRKSVAERSTKTGLEIRTSAGGKVPFKARENYYPHYIPEVNQLAKGRVRNEVLEAAVRRKDFKTLEEASSALDKYIAFQKSGGKDNLDYFAKRLIEEEAKKTSQGFRSTGAMKSLTDEQSAFGPGKYITKDKGVAKMYTDVAGGKVMSEQVAEPKKILNLSRQEDLDAFTKQAIKKYNLGVGKTGEAIQRLAKDMGYEAIDGDEMTGRLLLKETKPMSLAEARGKVLRYFRASRQQRYGNLERAREIDLPFYDPNPARVIPKYIAATERRLADAEVLGPNLERVDQLLGTVKNPDVQKTLRNLVKVARRSNEPGEQLAGKALDATRGLSTFRLGPLSGITNLGQSDNSLLASDAKSFTKGFAKAIFTKEGRRLPMQAGNLAESVLRSIQQQAGGDSRIVGAYLKGTGFTATEQLNRRVASNVGAEYGKSLYKQLLKKPNDKLIRAELVNLELNPDDLLKNGWNKDALLRAAKVFTDKTQFRSREIDLPTLSTTTALGKNLSQFKTFAFQQSRFIAKQTVGQLKTNPRRALRNVAILATVYPLTGEAIADLRAIATGKERDSRGLQRYLENAAQVGAFGILYDAVKSLSFEGGLAKFLAGPTISGIIDNIETTKQAFDKDFSDLEKRDYIRQIPGVGPIIANRVLPAEEKKDNKNLGSGKDVIKKTEFGEVTVSKPEFRVDGQNVGLKPKPAKEYQSEIINALTKSLSEVSKLPGWKEKTPAEKKKAFDKIFNKKKTAIKDRWLKEGKLNPDTVAGENRQTEGPANTFKVIANYGKGIVTDPEQTLRALFTEERLRDVVGPARTGVVRLERQKFLSLLDKGDKGKVIDHIIPLTLGGTNDPKNLRIVSEEKNKAKAKEEVRLLNLVKSGKITRKEAQTMIKRYIETGKSVDVPEKTSLLNKVLGIKTANAGTLPPAKTNEQKLANQIATIEGYKKTGTLADRNNNPGNLRFVGQSGAVKGDRGFAKFKTKEEGFQALIKQIRLDAGRSLTLKQFIYKYAPPKENNTDAYLRSVSRTLGVSQNTKLKDVIK